MRHSHLFIGGLHRSGTSLVHRLITSHPDVSGLRNAGVREDEGQHLQDVFPAAKEFGGPGRFARHEEMHLTEDDVGDAGIIRERLTSLWSPHWDTGKPVLAEKSPPNMIKARYLQEVFDDASFLMIVRHPLAVAEATQKMRRRPIPRHVGHWNRANRLMLDDIAALRRVRLMRYEDFCAAPQALLDAIFEFLGLDPARLAENVGDTNGPYLERWRAPGGERGKQSRAMTALGYRLDGPEFVVEPMLRGPFEDAGAVLLRT